MLAVFSRVRESLTTKSRQPAEVCERLFQRLAAGKQVDPVEVESALTAAGISPEEADHRVQALKDRVTKRQAAKAGADAVPSMKELSLLIETSVEAEKIRRAEFDATLEEQRGQYAALQEAIEQGKEAEQELFDSGSDASKENYRNMKQLEQGFGKTLGNAQADLAIVTEELRVANVRIGNVERETAQGDINVLRAAVRDLEAKQATAQQVVDKARAQFEAARESTKRARQLVIES